MGRQHLPVGSLSDFVAARMAEGMSGAATGTRAPGEDVPGDGAWQRLLVDYEGAVPLTEHWVRLELAVRALANGFADHPDHDPRWFVPAVTGGGGCS